MSGRRRMPALSTGSGAGRPNKLEDLVRALKAHVAFAEANRDTAELDVRRLVAEGGPLGVKKTTFYTHQNDERVAALAERLKELKDLRDASRRSVTTAIVGERGPRLARRSKPSGVQVVTTVMDEGLLAIRYAQLRQQALQVAEQLQGRLRRPSHVSAVPALAYHLDRMRSRVSALVVEANQLREQWQAISGTKEDNGQFNLLALDEIASARDNG